MDCPRQSDGQDHPPTDQQNPGQTEVEPISTGTPYIMISHKMSVLKVCNKIYEVKDKKLVLKNE